MKVEKVKIENYRLLKNFELDFRDDISLVVGKNNCGKTSVITSLEKALSDKNSNFSWYDFNVDLQKELFSQVSDFKSSSSKLDETRKGITLQVFIKYEDDDNFANIQNFIMDLDPENNTVVLEFNYSCDSTSFEKLCGDLDAIEILQFDDFYNFMTENCSKYFSLKRYSRGYDHITKMTTERKSKEIELNEIKKVLGIKVIRADRDASNQVNNNALSGLSQKYYQLIKAKVEVEMDHFNKAIFNANKELTIAYNGSKDKDDENPKVGIFEDMLNSIKVFASDTEISMQSTISGANLLKNSTTLFYKTESSYLPETYNGLGYLNLIGMILEMEIIISEMHGIDGKKSADINLIFIEEPEAHTHPQLQYIFIRNIKKMLEIKKVKEGKTVNVQTVITTHSAHILSECDFEDVRYLYREGNTVKSKNFQDLNSKFEGDIAKFNFVKKYLTMSRSELFFSDKAILVEGDTERILLPSMMKKIDNENKTRVTNVSTDGVVSHDTYVPLLSQNISIIEAGAYSHIFKDLLDFLQVKTLIITDLDLKKPKKNNTAETLTTTTNSSIRKFFGLQSNCDIKILTEKKGDDKVINNFRIAYQLEENNYQASTFEDAFLSINLDFVIEKIDSFPMGLKHKNLLEAKDRDYRSIAQKCINKKTAFASELIFVDPFYENTKAGVSESGKEEGWKVPKYIEEGLRWLQK